MGLLHRGATMVMKALRQTAGETVTYRRGADSIEITAVPGRANDTQLIDDGLSMSVDELLWKVRPEDLVIASVRIQPEDGDRIERTVAGATLVYVVRTESGLPRFTTDPLNSCITIRSKLESGS